MYKQEGCCTHSISNTSTLHTPCTKFIMEENGQVTILTPEGRIFQTIQETLAPLNIKENVSLPINGYVVENLLDHLRNNTPLRPCYLSQLWAIGLMANECPADAVTINVGGVLFRISLSLLTSKFDYFAALYGRWNNVEKVFVDRSCDSFCRMLNHVCLPDEKYVTSTIEKELVFFGYKEEEEAESKISVPSAEDFWKLPDQVPESTDNVQKLPDNVPEAADDLEKVWRELKKEIVRAYNEAQLTQDKTLFCYVPTATTQQRSVVNERLQELGYSDIGWHRSVVWFRY